MMLQLEESRITQLLKETIRVICRSADSCSEIAIKGLLGITLDRREIFLVQIDDVIDMALERTGTPFHANVNNISSAPQSSQSSFNQATEQLQSRHDLNLAAGSADARTLNNAAIPENHTARQTWKSVSSADLASRSLLQSQGQRGEKVKAKSSVSLHRLSDVKSRKDCSSAAAVSAADITVPRSMTDRTAVACIPNSGRGKGRGQFGRGRGQFGNGRGQFGRGRGQFGSGRGQYGSGRGQFGSGRGQYGSGKGQLGRGRGQLGSGRGQFGRGRGQFGRGRGQSGRGRGHHGRGRGKQSVISSYRNEDLSVSVSDGVSGVQHSDDVKMKTRSSFISETHHTIISSFDDTVNNYSQYLEKLDGGNRSQTVSTVQSAEHKTLKTLKQPAFKRKLKPFGVITSKKSKRANDSADSGVVIIKPKDTSRGGLCLSQATIKEKGFVVGLQPTQASSSDEPLNRCSVCKRAFTKLTDLAEHYTTEHSTNSHAGHSASPASKAADDETSESFRCFSPSCSRTFPTQRGMLQHCGRSHSGRGGRLGLTGTGSGTVRKSSTFGTHGNVDEKPAAGSVVGQILPSLSFAFEPRLFANVHANSLPHTITRDESSNTGREDDQPLSSLVAVKQEIDAVQLPDNW